MKRARGPDKSFPVAQRPSVVGLVLAGVLTVGALLRVLYLVEISKNPDFSHPQIDAHYHDYWANGLASGDWTVPPGFADPLIRSRPFFRPPGYAYFLALIYLIFGHNYLAPRIAQMAIGLGSCLLAFIFGRKWFGSPVGLIFAALLSFYWIFIYFEGELLALGPEVFLTLLLLLVMSLWITKTDFVRGVLSGAVLGLLALFRPNVLLFAPVAVVWLIWQKRGTESPKRIFTLIAGLLVGALLSISPATVRNRLVADDAVLIAANGGMSLLIGNNPDADGTNHYLPGFGFVKSPYDYPRAVKNLEKKLGLRSGSLKYSQASRYYAREAAGFILNQPLKSLKLTVRKIALFWGPMEVTNIKEMFFARGHSPLLRRLPGNFPALLSLSLVGIFLLAANLDARPGQKGPPGPARSAGVLVLFFTAAYFISMLPFVAAARYRVPVLPGLLLFGAYALHRISELILRRRLKTAALVLAAWGFLYLLARVNLTGYRPSESKWHYDLALAYSSQRKIPLAMEEYRQALRVNPGDVQAHNNLGALLLSSGRIEEAIEHYQQALRLQPDQAETYSNLGDAFARQGDTKEAMRFFHEALRLDPECVQAHNNLAIALEKLGRGEEAIRHYRQALEIKPAYAEAHYNLGLALGKRGQVEEAIEHYRQAIRANPDHAEAHNNLGNALAARGQIEEAARHYLLALSLDANLANAHNNLGNILAHQGKFTEAIQHYQRALEINPAYAEAHFNFGVTLALKGEVAPAREQYRKALEIDPANVNAHYNLGLLLLAEGRKEEAKEHFEEAIKLQPGFEAARKALGRQ